MMFNLSPRRPTALICLLGLSLSPLACSDEDADTEETTEEHDHTTPIEVSAENAPTLEVKAHADGAAFNLELIVENFEFAPENASTDHLEGEGHAHIYVDGKKLGRVYGSWYYLGGLEEGEHEVRVELSANSHNPLSVEGELIDDMLTIDVPAPVDAHAHEHLMVDWEPVPSVMLHIHEDPMSGWNVEALPEDFTLAPEHVSSDHVEGEGHMHLYVNDTKVTRMYGNWYHLAEMPLGTNTVRVELSTNDHRALMFDDALIFDSVEVEVKESDSHSHGEEAAGGAHH